MQRHLNFLIGGLVAAMFSLTAAAQQPGTAPQGTGGAPAMAGTEGAANSGGACAKSRDPQRCEALQKAKETCKDKTGVNKRKCMMDAMPPMDCSKTRYPERCEAAQKAKEVCKDKPAAEYRQCMRDNMPRRGGKAAQKTAPKN
jgi:hypothetical protein